MNYLKRLVSVTMLLTLTSLLLAFNNSSANGDIVIENSEMRLLLSSSGEAKSLLHKRSGEECLQQNCCQKSIFALTEFRPYATELMLTYSAKPRKYWANRVERIDNKLIVGFEEILYTATIDLNITDYYIGFKLEKLEYTIGKIGVEKRKTEIDEFTLLELPIKRRTNFGEWLNVAWDDQIAVNLLATDQYARIDGEPCSSYVLMSAEIDNSIELKNVGAALIVTETKNLLSCIDQLERDYNLPLGAESRLKKEYRYSYYEPKMITPDNADEHIEWALKGGFRQMLIYYEDAFASVGHYLWREQYPNKIEDLKLIVKKIRDAGIIPGFHIHYNKARINDPYVTPVPDSRLNLSNSFTLAAPLSKDDSIIYLEESPRESTLENGRRLLMINGEILSYESYSTEPPYMFIGCRRGELGTEPAEGVKGEKLGLLDVDTWPIFIRFDQRTGIQQETAKRISDIYNQCGFEFIYFDGAEDVHYPYWYNVSKAQLDVYKLLNPAPLLAEAATKSHFSWHMISRGNAFDTFPPEHVKEATDIYQVNAAKYMRESFSSMNFGWNNYIAPNDNSIGMQPDMYEYICSRAAAWDSPIGLFGRPDQFRSHPRTEDNLRVMRMWEEVRNEQLLSEEQKREIRESESEHHLFKNREGKYEVIPCSRVESIAEGSSSIRAFLFSREGKTWAVIWHTHDKALLRIPVSSRDLTLYDINLSKIKFQKNGGFSSTITVKDCNYLTFNLSIEESVKVLKESILVAE